MAISANASNILRSLGKFHFRKAGRLAALAATVAVASLAATLPTSAAAIPVAQAAAAAPTCTISDKLVPRPVVC